MADKTAYIALITLLSSEQGQGHLMVGKKKGKTTKGDSANKEGVEKEGLTIQRGPLLCFSLQGEG